MCERWDFSKGYLHICIETRLDLNITGSHKDLNRKQPYLFFLPWVRDGLQVAAARSWPFQSQGGGGGLALG
jgi:hypothetical protein